MPNLEQIPPQTAPEQLPLSPEKVSINAEQEERETEDRQALSQILSTPWLDPQTALEIVAAYDTKALEDPATEKSLREFTLTYGLQLDELSEQRRSQLLMLYASREQAKRGTAEHISMTLERVIQEALTEDAITKIDRLAEYLLKTKEVKETEAVLREVMGSMAALVKHASLVDKKQESLWQGIAERFQGLVNIKKKSGVELSQVFSNVFSEFSDFIEDEFVVHEMQRLDKGRIPYSAEHVIREVYGRTKEEIEAIKSKNRIQVAERIQQLKEEPYPTYAQVEELARINNAGIVPKSEVRLRQGDELITFGYRVGVLPEDVASEIQGLFDRAEQLIDKDILTEVSSLRYGIEAAKLHNAFLEIHPFNDRNGSTALLFLELMMARKGYDPSSARDSNYYHFLRKVLNDNPIAISAVGYEQYLIAHVSGYYQGETTKEKKPEYEKRAQRKAKWINEQKRKK